MRLAVFAYGSLVNATSAAETLARSVEPVGPARLAGWERSWSLLRDNRRSEKTFALEDGTVPPFCLGLNVLPGAGEGPNGSLIEVSSAELERLALREVRYDRVEVTDAISAGRSLAFDRVFTFTAKPGNLSPTAPSGAVILASYLRAVESAFATLGHGELELYRETTLPQPVPAVEASLVADRIPPGNPRAW